MFKEIAVQLRLSVIFVIVFTVLVGLIYPGLCTLIGKTLFSRQAEGSLIEVNGKKVGSEIIGQPFDDPKYFWSRPSATPDANGKALPYNGGSSYASNLGPTNPALTEAVKGRIDALRA